MVSMPAVDALSTPPTTSAGCLPRRDSHSSLDGAYRIRRSGSSTWRTPELALWIDPGRPIQPAPSGVVTVAGAARTAGGSFHPARRSTFLMNGYRPMPPRAHASDAELMRRVADCSEESLGLLYRRFARLIVGLASQTLDRAAAEDIVQDVFLAVWRNAATFDPERGSVRAWILQIAHFRLLNELRRRSRQPELETDPEGHVLASLPARDPGPAEAAAAEHRRATLQS